MRYPLKTLGVIFTIAFAIAVTMRYIAVRTCQEQRYDPDLWTDYHPYNKSKQSIMCTKNLDDCYFVYQSGHCYNTCTSAEERCYYDEEMKLSDGNLGYHYAVIRNYCEKEKKECVSSCQNKQKPTWIARHRIWH